MDQIQYTWLRQWPLSEEMGAFEDDVALRLGFGRPRPVQPTTALHRMPVPVANSNKCAAVCAIVYGSDPQMSLREQLRSEPQLSKSFGHVLPHRKLSYCPGSCTEICLADV